MSPKHQKVQAEKFNPGSQVECIHCAQDPKRFMQWVVRFKRMDSSGTIDEWYGGNDANQPPDVVVGSMYNLEMEAIPAGEAKPKP